MPVNLYSLLVGFLIRDFWKALFTDLCWKIIGTTTIFFIGRCLLKDIIINYFSSNKVFLTLQLLVAKDP